MTIEAVTFLGQLGTALSVTTYLFRLQYDDGRCDIKLRFDWRLQHALTQTGTPQESARWDTHFPFYQDPTYPCALQ